MMYIIVIKKGFTIFMFASLWFQMEKRVIIFLTKCYATFMIRFISQLLDKYDAIYLKRGVQFSYAYSMSIIYISLITCIGLDTYHMIYKIWMVSTLLLEIVMDLKVLYVKALAALVYMGYIMRLDCRLFKIEHYGY